LKKTVDAAVRIVNHSVDEAAMDGAADTVVAMARLAAPSHDGGITAGLSDHVVTAAVHREATSTRRTAA
jgi:hypothetical protein